MGARAPRYTAAVPVTERSPLSLTLTARPSIDHRPSVQSFGVRRVAEEAPDMLVLAEQRAGTPHFGPHETRPRMLFFTLDRGGIPRPDDDPRSDTSAWGIRGRVEGYVVVDEESLQLTSPRGSESAWGSVVRRGRGFAVLVSALTVPLAASPALASEPAASTTEVDPAVAEVKDLMFEAGASYDTSNYGKAVELFTEAYKKALGMEDAQLREQVLHSLFYNLARAHVKAYEIDGDVQHLNQAKDLLKKYLGQDELEDDMDAESLLSEVENKLESEDDEETEETAAPAPGPVTPADQPPPPPPSKSGMKPGTGFVIGGAVAVGLGGVLLATGIGFGAYLSFSSAYLWGPIAGLVFAGVGAGIPLIIVGKKKQFAYDQQRGVARLSLAPARTPRGGWGGQLRFSF